jgi:hypothetical protein
MQARTKRRAGSPILAAMGVAMVASDHHITPKPRTCFPPMRSAQIPPAIWKAKLTCKIDQLVAQAQTLLENFKFSVAG